MAKRIAERELTDRNWDQEEEEEEAGQFSAADKATMKHRKIITAKRRSTPSMVSSGTGLFSSFSGFGSAAPSGNSKTVGFSLPPNKPFLFGAGSSGTTSTTTSSVSCADTKSAEMPSYTSAVISSSNGTKPTIPTLSTVPATTTDKNFDNQDPQFYSNLKKLNESVLKWIEKHVAENPYCILSPIFIDYNNHLTTIQKNKLDSSNVETLDFNQHKNGSSTNSSTDSTSITSSINTQASASMTSTLATPFVSVSTTTTSSPWPISSISNSIFSSSTTTKSSVFGSTGFSFQTSDTKSAFSFASDVAKIASSTKPADEEEEYEPPKPENKEIKEEGSVYTKRCKLFYEKEKNWIDKGVANLHVKPLKDKAQLIVRADTNLGNILLNINLLPSMQLKRQGKNNVSLVCIPNPPVSKDSENKLIPMLLRVKSAEEADELLDVLNKHKCGTESEAAE